MALICRTDISDGCISNIKNRSRSKDVEMFFSLFFVMFVSVLNHWSLFQDDSGALEIHGSGLQVSLIAGKPHCALSGVSHHKMERRTDVPSNTLTTDG